MNQDITENKDKNDSQSCMCPKRVYGTLLNCDLGGCCIGEYRCGDWAANRDKWLAEAERDREADEAFVRELNIMFGREKT